MANNEASEKSVALPIEAEEPTTTIKQKITL